MNRIYAHECLCYDPIAGTLQWKDRPEHHFSSYRVWRWWNGRYAGKPAGNKAARGGMVVCINNKTYHAHRLIWLMVNGDPGSLEIDHINGDPMDNRMSNLRLVTSGGNSKNMRLPSHNTSGVIGVYWDKKSGKWQAKIQVEGKQIHLGLYEEKEGAVRARADAEMRYGFHPNHGRAAARAAP